MLLSLELFNFNSSQWHSGRDTDSQTGREMFDGGHAVAEAEATSKRPAARSDNASRLHGLRRCPGVR